MKMIHASEQQHWYTRDGQPCYQVPAVKGGMRSTHLGDARKLGLLPSVTSIIKCAAAPQLEVWKQQQVLHAALTLPTIPGEAEDKYLARIMQDSKEQARKASEKGTAIHAAIQGHYEGQPPEPEYLEYVKGAVAAVKSWVNAPMDVVMEAERSLGHGLGYGGKIDLCRRQNPEVVLDFKTKEFDSGADLKTWDEHHMQLAAYRIGINRPRARCAIVYVSVTNPGLIVVKEISEPLLLRGWEMFKSLLDYWYAKTGLQRERACATALPSVLHAM